MLLKKDRLSCLEPKSIMKKQELSKNKMGFSLIELSIVILVIGILVIGITKGSAVMTKAKLGSARALTNDSPVLQISDLFVWYEPVLKSSFTTANAFDATSLSGGWLDNSPSKSALNNAAAVGVVPLYEEDGINSLPTVDFSAGAARLTFSSAYLNQKDYTIFVVEQKRSVTDSQRFLNLGDVAGINAFGYKLNTAVEGTTSAHTVTVPALVGTAYTSRIITFLTDISVTNGRKAFVNGTAGTGVNSAAAISVGATGVIGADNSAGLNPYIGYISEVIIYYRALKADERNDIQEYLSKKYGIKVAQSS
jgi:prepilin-type N-terminal cleavage/methylation domain-containing protein